MFRQTSRLDLALRAAVALGVAMAPLPVPAQIFAGIGGDRTLAMPGETPPAASAAQPSPAAADPIRHLPGTLEGWRLTGEIGSLRWPVYLTEAQAAAPSRFRVGFVSAIALLPEASRLEVSINDTAIGSAPLDAAQATSTVEFAVPPGVTRHGYNAISIRVEQRHRVDCSVGATYELWTKFDPEQTGLLLAGSHDVTDLGELAALRPAPDGTMPIHIQLTGKIGPSSLKLLMAATQRLALGGGFLQPAIDFDTGASEPYGIDLVLGTRTVLAGLPRVAGALGTAGPVATLLAPAETGRPALLVTGTNAADLEKAVDLIPLTPKRVGTASGLLAKDNYPAFRSEGGEHLRLSELAVKSESFSGRFFRKSFNLALPADFLASDYGRGSFDLAGGYAAGLSSKAQVSVDVNGRSSGVIKLLYRSGDQFKHNQLFLPLSLMRPGLNRIDVFAETERPEDGTCAAPDAKRFLFLDTSEIVLPRLARIARLPDLALATSGGLPFTSGTPRLVVPKPDRDTMGAALSLTTRAAVAAGAPIAFTFATDASATADGPTLVVAPARLLDPALVKAVGVDPTSIEAAWRDLAPTAKPDGRAGSGVKPRWWLSNADGPAACRRPVQVAAKPTAAARPIVHAALTVPAPAVHDDIIESWSVRAPDETRWGERAAAALASVKDWLATRVRQPTVTAHRDGIAPQASLILAQGFTGHAGNLTTIVTGPDAEAMRASITCLFDPQVWSQVHGRLATLDASSGAVVATDASEVRYVASGPWSLGNARLVLAGWLSLNPSMFVMLALMMAMCLSVTTFWYVRGVGRKPE